MDTDKLKDADWIFNLFFNNAKSDANVNAKSPPASDKQAQTDSTAQPQPVPIPYVPDKSKTIARGIWIDKKQRERDMRIVHRNKCYAINEETGDIDRTQYDVGEFYYLQVGSARQRGAYKGYGQCFCSYDDALLKATDISNGTISWLSQDQVQPSAEEIIDSISKENITLTARMNGWTLCFIEMDYNPMIEYAKRWAKKNDITSKTSELTDDIVEQKREIIFAIIDYFGPRDRPHYTGGLSTYNGLRGELLYNGGLGWDDDDWDTEG